MVLVLVLVLVFVLVFVFGCLCCRFAYKAALFHLAFSHPFCFPFLNSFLLSPPLFILLGIIHAAS